MAIFKSLLLALSLAATRAAAHDPEETCGPAQVITYVPPPITFSPCTKTMTVPVPTGGPAASTYTTVFPAFCPSGTCDVTYIVHEEVCDKAPETLSCAGAPRGFKTDVITYVGDNSAHVTKTICYPVNGPSVVACPAAETCATTQGVPPAPTVPVTGETVKISPTVGYVVTFLAVLFLL